MKMKKKFLSVAVLAAMAAGSAQAVNLGNDGTGQVLLFPYYTVQGGEETLLSVVNTTDMHKAVKIRFREAYNSREVLDFNIYLSPYDVWVAKIRDAADGGAEVWSPDNSCTVPLSISQHVAQPFKTNGFSGANIDGLAKDSGPQGIERVREGYVEVIEMGVADTTVTSVWDNNGNGIVDSLHNSSGMPDNCAGIASNFGVEWPTSYGTPAPAGFLPPEGGLMGALSVINVQAGTQVSVNAVALADVFETVNHYSTGSLNPTLAQAEETSTVLVNAGMGGNGVADEPVVLTDIWADPIDAVSATLMAASVMNEWTVNPSVNAESAWVVTFPTKWAYVDEGNHAITTPRLPFTDEFQEAPAVDGMACETVKYTIYDREEQSTTPQGCDFSPCEVGESTEICYEVNVIQFGDSNIMSAANTVTHINSSALPGAKTNGWMSLDMYGVDVGLASHVLAGGHSYFGLPVVGFEASVLGNANVGVGASYGTSNPHAYKRVQS